MSTVVLRDRDRDQDRVGGWKKNLRTSSSKSVVSTRSSITPGTRSSTTSRSFLSLSLAAAAAACWTSEQLLIGLEEGSGMGTPAPNNASKVSSSSTPLSIAATASS
ncbi:hypothetical protein ACLKA6_004858 [Drosophila palustris]